MPELEIKNSKGEKVAKARIPDFMFELAGGERLIHEVVRMQQSRRRRGTASTKTRSEVKASGRKPWRQKGTGRARVGDRGSPLWRGGGIIFGPKPRNFSFSVPKKVKRKALKSALAIRFRNDRVTVIKKIELGEPKTKQLLKILQQTGAGDDLLILTARRDRNVHLAARNLPGVETCGIRELNTLSVLSHSKLLITEEALGHLESWMKKVK